MAMLGSADGSVAVIGAGIAGCGVAARLRQLGWRGPIRLWEMGRAPGGRASTRRSRFDPSWRLNHGAPLFQGEDPAARALLEPLRVGGWIQPWIGSLAWVDGAGQLHAGAMDPMERGTLWQGATGMDGVARGLLALAGAEVALTSGTMVHGLARSMAGGWRLLARDGGVLGQADWLVLSGSLLAHPRSCRLLALPVPPLAAAVRPGEDPLLDQALAALGALRYEGRCQLLAMVPAERAPAWRALPFQLLRCDGAAQRRWGVERLVLEPGADGRCGVVVHSTADFAAAHAEVIGAHSTAARLGGDSGDGTRQREVITALAGAVAELLAPWLGAAATLLADVDPQVMRWGAAFPLAPGLPPSLTLCPASRVAFCGDGVAGTGFGRIEGALVSADRLAQMLMAAGSGAGLSGAGTTEISP